MGGPGLKVRSLACSPEVSRLAAVQAVAWVSGGAGFEPDGPEVVAGGESHVGVKCGG
jgi:hypothetical protein